MPDFMIDNNKNFIEHQDIIKKSIAIRVPVNEGGTFTTSVTGLKNFLKNLNDIISFKIEMGSSSSVRIGINPVQYTYLINGAVLLIFYMENNSETSKITISGDSVSVSNMGELFSSSIGNASFNLVVYLKP